MSVNMHDGGSSRYAGGMYLYLVIYLFIFFSNVGRDIF